MQIIITLEIGDLYTNPTTPQQIKHNKSVNEAIHNIQQDIIFLSEKCYALCTYEHINNKSILIAENTQSIITIPHTIHSSHNNATIQHV